MKKKQLKYSFKYPLYCVVWDDAVSQDDDNDPNKDLQLTRLTTVGFLLKDTAKYVTLCFEYCEKEDWVRHKTTIPKGMIIERWEICVT